MPELSKTNEPLMGQFHPSQYGHILLIGHGPNGFVLVGKIKPGNDCPTKIIFPGKPVPRKKTNHDHAPSASAEGAFWLMFRTR